MKALARISFVVLNFAMVLGCGAAIDPGQGSVTQKTQVPGWLRGVTPKQPEQPPKPPKVQVGVDKCAGKTACAATPGAGGTPGGGGAGGGKGKL
jgi:hypothetical protein